jgi:hypothetical protein
MTTEKVWGVVITPNPDWGATTRQVRVIVAARSQKAAVEALQEAGARVTVGFLRTYGAVTGNATEVAVATASPGQVFFAEDRFGSDYLPARNEGSP